MNNTPCKDCKERYLGCHDHCFKYQEFKKQKEQENKNRRKAEQSRSLIYAAGMYHHPVLSERETYKNRKSYDGKKW